MSLKTWIVVLTLGLAVCFGYWIHRSEFFEKKPPVVRLMVQVGNEEKEIQAGDDFWNPHRDMVVYMNDESGIKSYNIVAKDNQGRVLAQKQEAIVKRPKAIKVNLPKPDVQFQEGDQIYYEISVNDWSNAHFFSGNVTRLNFKFTIDTEAPVVRMIATSYKISYGGSALLVFKINDKSTKEVRVTNGEEYFKAYPFLKEGYYALIIAWPIKNKVFAGNIIAIDKAWNVKKVAIPIIKDPNVRYRYSDIKVTDQFLNTKLDNLVNIIGERSTNSFPNSLEKFRYINEYIRSKDENVITGVTQAVNYPGFLSPIAFNVFLPLKKFQVVGSFGDHRTYLYKNVKFSQSMHLGLDIANFKYAPILASNAGRVLFAGLLGVYGNTTIIDHGFGLASLYSHQSSFEVKANDLVSLHQEIGRTGQTGWAFGDHLHLGILVQGQMVRVAEWMDAKWIKTNITDVFARAQRIIQNSEE